MTIKANLSYNDYKLFLFHSEEQKPDVENPLIYLNEANSEKAHDISYKTNWQCY